MSPWKFPTHQPINQETAGLRERKLKDQIIIEARRHVILDAGATIKTSNNQRQHVGTNG